MIKMYLDNSYRADVYGAAVAVADAPEELDSSKDFTVDELDAYIQSINDRIEELQRSNPAFKDAAEIFLVPDKSGNLSKLIAIWCTDCVELDPTRLPIFMIEDLFKLKRVQRRLGPDATNEDLAEAMNMSSDGIEKLLKKMDSLDAYKAAMAKNPLVNWNAIKSMQC